MRPYIVLGTYNPTKPWRAWKVGRDLTELTRSHGLVPIRDPKHRHQRGSWRSRKLCAYVRRRTVSNPKAASWHQDGDLVAGAQMDNCLVLWSSNTPTQIKGLDGEIYTPNPREVILFRNRGCYHKRPDNCPLIRWLFRQRVEIPKHMELP